MKIEIEIDENAIAKAVAKIVGKAPAKPAKAAKPVEDDAPDADDAPEADDTAAADDFEGAADEGDGDDAGVKLTVEDVRESLVAVSKKFGQDSAMKILKDVGEAPALSKLKEAKFEAVIAAAKKKAASKK